jgi:hypothetical protein
MQTKQRLERNIAAVNAVFGTTTVTVSCLYPNPATRYRIGVLPPSGKGSLGGTR